MAFPAAGTKPTINTSLTAFSENFTTLLLIFLAQVLIFLAGAHTILRSILSKPLGPESWGNVTAVEGWLAALGNDQGSGFSFWLLSTAASILSVLYVAVPALYYAKGRRITVRMLLRELSGRPWRYGIIALPALVLNLLKESGLLLIAFVLILLLEPVFVNLIVTTEDTVQTCLARTVKVSFDTAAGRSLLFTVVFSWLIVFLVSILTCGLGWLIALPTRDFFLQHTLYDRVLLAASE